MREVVIIGAGAAGLMAGIFVARAGTDPLLLDGAAKLGAKILVAGGGRCNVTHDQVDPRMYAGSSQNAIKKVLKRFDVPQTIAFFEELGVKLKRESTGKLFPTTDSARTVLDALLKGLHHSRGVIQHPCRVEAIQKIEGGFRVVGDWGEHLTKRVILATGGRSLPKSGSDGVGYGLAQGLGHTLTKRIFPALVPLTLPRDHFICSLSGITLPTQLTVFSGKNIISFTDSTLCTHFGLSGPAPLDISRHYQSALLENPNTFLYIHWLPEISDERLDSELQGLGNRSVARWLNNYLPERLALALCQQAEVVEGQFLTRSQRRALVEAITRMALPITGNRGFTYAEVTAGGIPLSEIRLETMESRACAGLYLCGEICDVDGRIGGYNFQWAWSSGYVAGSSAGISEP